MKPHDVSPLYHLTGGYNVRINDYEMAQNLIAPAAWALGLDGTGVGVAVIDSGIEGTHPEFAGKFSDSVSQFCDPGGNKDIGTDNSSCVAQAPTQACFHGTAVAGVAAAGGDNAIGVAGLSWGAKLVSMKVFRDADCPDDCGSTACGTDDWAMADALSFLAAKHNNASYGKIVANLSVGCPGCD